MFTKTNQSNNLRRWLIFLYFFSTLSVTIFILYLESGYHGKNVINGRADQLDDSLGDKQLLDLKHFRYVINSQVCGKQNRKKILTVVIVTSYAGDVDMRNTIRRAYPARILSKFGVRRIFLLALVDEKKEKVTQEMILDESQKFNDILQGNFIEDYRNLTYKHVMGLQWVTEYCFQAKYNLLLAGYVMNHMKPMRDPTNKWFVTNKEYPRQDYPNFLIDDLYVTGLLVEKTNITFVKLNRYYTTHPEYLQCCIDKPNFICDYLIGPVGNDNRLMLLFEKFSENCFYKTCRKRGENNSLKSTCIAKWKDEPFGKGRASVDLITLS
ncbi:UNVERIFIED_CONTAM: hypothetical protein PYX00_001883 [Menopon gallinae]|uniref:Hexosyltransferase n=1 Tax=Menopon gallinae TaxID=328185 RepID=A0AAW2IFU9_9NEOP